MVIAHLKAAFNLTFRALDLGAFGRVVTRYLDPFDRHGVGVGQIALPTLDGMQFDPCLAKVDDEQHSLVEIPPEPTHIPKRNRRHVSIANVLAEGLVLETLVDGVADGVLAVVVDRSQIEIVIAAVLGSRLSGSRSRSCLMRGTCSRPRVYSSTIRTSKADPLETFYSMCLPSRLSASPRVLGIVVWYCLFWF